jgi:hypothetical protein
MGAISQLVHLLAKAESGGGFDLIAGTLKRVGRYPREHDVRDSRRSVGTLPLPNHDFDIDVVKWADGTYILLIAGRPRYAGFTFYDLPLNEKHLPPRDLDRCSRAVTGLATILSQVLSSPTWKPAWHVILTH